jgi:tetratricopeptide (TPR) repeat protein
VSVTTFAALSLDDAFASAPARNDNRVFARVRSDLDVEAFGVYAVRALGEGVQIVEEHTQTGPGGDRQEMLFFVSSGRAEFSVDGAAIDAPAGTFVFVREPEAARAAVAKEEGTTIVGFGARRGEPWRLTPGEALNEFFPLHTAKDYEGAAAVARQVLDEYPGNGLALYNLSCCESLLGSSDDALEHLSQALAAAPSLKKNAQSDDDFAAIREDARFRQLIAG